MDGGAWWAAVHGVTKSWTWLSDFTFTFHFHALEKGMATHSSVLAWRIPGTGEPGGLTSMGSHRVGHDWSDLAAAAAVFHTTFFKSIYPPLDIWIAYTSWLLWTVLLWIWVSKYLIEALFSILLHTHPGVGFLEHIVVLFLIFLRNLHIVFHRSCTIL